ncbi:MAG: flagellar protein FlaG [Methylococcaceae bacterium]|nr:MAG: flagellar protein FlaG [Methylococcaceae bacterium]
METLPTSMQVSVNTPQYTTAKSKLPESGAANKGQEQPSAFSSANAVRNATENLRKITSTTESDALNKPKEVNDSQESKETKESKESKDLKELDDAVSKVNRFFEQVSRELRFQRSESTNQMVVQVIDHKTGEVIRQFPSEEMLKISKELEKISGLLFKDKA